MSASELIKCGHADNCLAQCYHCHFEGRTFVSHNHCGIANVELSQVESPEHNSDI